MAKGRGRAGKRALAAGRGRPRARKSGAPKAPKSASRKAKPAKPEPTKSASRKRAPSAASEAAALKRQLQAARAQQQATAEILRAVADAAGDVARPLQFIAETTARLFAAQSVSIQLAEGREFTQEYRVGSIAKRVGSAYPRSNIKVGGRNLPGTVVAEVRQIHIPDLDHLNPSMADFPGLPHARAGGARTVCGTPLRREGNAIGALIVFRDVLAPFTDDELALLQSFADQAVIAIENARLFNEVQAKSRDLSESLQHQTATADVLKVISRSVFDVQVVLDTLVESACRLCGAKLGLLYLKGDDAFECKAIAGSGVEDANTYFKGRPIRSGRATAAERVIMTGQVESVTDFFTDPEFDPNAKEIIRKAGNAGLGVLRSTLAVPMMRDGAVVGVLVIASTQTGAFPQRQIDLLQTFADQAVIAIENARLFNETQEALERQTATAGILKVIASSPSDVQPVFDTIAASANRLLGGNGSAVTRVIDGQVHLVAASSDAVRQTLSSSFPQSLSEARSHSRVAASGVAVIHDDVLGVDSFPAEAKAAARAYGYRSLIIVPMLHGGVAIGTLGVGRPQAGGFSPHHIKLLETFADQAVIAIENVRLFEEVQAKTRDLEESLQQQTASAEVLQIISNSPGELQPVFRAVLENATRICDARFGTLLRFDGSNFYFVADVGTPEALAEYVRRPGPFRGLGGGMIDRIHRTRQVQHSPDYAADAAPGIAAKLGGARSTLGVPILRDDVLVGAIVIYRQEVRPFSDREIELVRSFAAQAAIAIENARLFNETKEALEQQTATSEVLQVIGNSMADSRPVFARILDSTMQLFDCRQSTLMLAPGDGLMHVGAHRGAGSEVVERVYPQPIGETMAATVLEKRQQTYIADVMNDSQASLSLRRVADVYGNYSIVMTPMIWEGQGIGLISVIREPNMPFNAKELGLLRTFADQAVIAIQNARLFNETREALAYQTGSSNVLRVIASSPTNVDPVLEAIVESARELCEANDAVALLKDGDHLRFSAHSGPIPVNVEKWPISRRWTAGRAFVDQTPVHVHNMLSEDAAEFPDAKLMSRNTGLVIHTVLSVPLLRGNESIGAILLRRTELRPFNDKQIGLLSTFADQAVIAIQNAQQFNETQQALERQTATSDILNVIAGSPTDTKPVFDAIASRAKSLVGGFSSTVFRFIDGRAHLEAFTPTTPEADEILRSTFPRSVDDFAPFRMAQSGEVTQISDVEALTDEIKDIGRARGFRSMLFAPLMNKAISIGFIVVTRVQPGQFEDHHVQLLKTFADQAVIAIENVRLFDEVQSRTSDLQESLQQQTATADVLKVISRSAFDLQSVFDTLAQSAADLCAVNLCGLHIREGDFLVCRGYAGASKEQQDFVRQMRFPINDTNYMMSRVLNSGEIANIADFDTAPVATRTPQKVLGFKALLMVPLMREGQGIGLFVLGRDRVGEFSPRHIELVQTFADQAVIAIENARLFDEVQARTRELSKSLDDLRAAQDRLVQTEKLASLGQLTAGIAHEIKNPLNFVNNFAALSGELIDEMSEVFENPALDDAGRRKELDEIRELLKSNLEKVVQHGKRADSIVKNMLQHSREGSGERRASDLNALVSESLNLAYHGARAEGSDFNITLEQDLDPDAGEVDVYPQELTRALLNLISNGFYAAVKRKKEADGNAFEPVLSAVTKNAGDAVEIRIRDNGAGIPAEIMEKIFNPFFTTKPTGEGTGLGLSMTHDIIVKQHGGSIDVATEPGAFTEFRITLPRGNGAARPGHSE